MSNKLNVVMAEKPNEPLYKDGDLFGFKSSDGATVYQVYVISYPPTIKPTSSNFDLINITSGERYWATSGMGFNNNEKHFKRLPTGSVVTIEVE